MSVPTETVKPEVTPSHITGLENQGDPKIPIDRRHDLDALRAVAMLLGIVLHAALAFAPIPWTVNDSQQSDFYSVLFAMIHGFRMPLFFLVSGFFTAMLWRKRGFAKMFKQRSLRIGLPLILGCFTIIPAMWAVIFFVSQAPKDSAVADVFRFLSEGKTEAAEASLDEGNVALDAVDPASGSTMLTVAAFCGHPETVGMLLSRGADVHQKNRDAGTALHAAVFMGRVESSKKLLLAGADPNVKDGNGNTPQDNLKIDFATTQFVAQMFGQSVQQEELEEARLQIAELMGADQATMQQLADSGQSSSNPAWQALYGLLFQVPAFMHLWFLAFLCWMVLAFGGYSIIVNAINFDFVPRWLVCSPASLLWLVPLTMIPQSLMTQGSFGPDSSVGLLPLPSVLVYYAIFFFFGAVYWDMKDDVGRLSQAWGVTLSVALLIVFPIGLEIVSGTFGLLSKESMGISPSVLSLLGNFLQSLFAWMMIIGSIGMFRAFFREENKTMRYVSDSSYWLYLVHLPLVVLAQWFVKDLPIPGLVKFLGIIVVVTAVLLISYEYGVRYTVIGKMLNGPRKRVSKDPQTL